MVEARAMFAPSRTRRLCHGDRPDNGGAGCAAHCADLRRERIAKHIRQADSGIATGARRRSCRSCGRAEYPWQGYTLSGNVSPSGYILLPPALAKCSRGPINSQYRITGQVTGYCTYDLTSKKSTDSSGFQRVRRGGRFSRSCCSTPPPHSGYFTARWEKSPHGTAEPFTSDGCPIVLRPI